MPTKCRLLFLCTGNSCRSQMAEGFANHLKPDELTAVSAGVEIHGMNPHAVTVMAEAGVDISGQKSKLVDTFRGHTFDAIITLCGHAHETCPFFPGGARVIHHGFDDPPRLAEGKTDPEEILAAYRKVRDEIKDFILTLPGALALDINPEKEA